MSDDGGTESENDEYDDDDGYDWENEVSEMPSQARPPQVAPNKIQELVSDNAELCSIVRKITSNFETKFNLMETFCMKLRKSSKLMSAAYKRAQQTIQNQLTRITLLESEKSRLQNGLGDSQPAPQQSDQGEYSDNLNDTISHLAEKLTKEREEKTKILLRFEEIQKTRMEEFNAQWIERERKIDEYITGLKADCHKLVEDAKVECLQKLNEKQMEFDHQDQNNKQRSMLLLADIDKCNQEKQILQQHIATFKSLAQQKEERIHQLNIDMKTMEDQSKNMQAYKDQIIRLKQELEDAQLIRRQKEESLDQLFRVYYEEKGKKEKLEVNSKKLGEELDKALAQYLCAEESLKRKNDEVAAVTQRLREVESGTQIGAYIHQAEIFRKDFEMERQARQELHQENESNKAKLNQFKMEMARMKDELMKYQNQQFQHKPGGYGP